MKLFRTNAAVILTTLMLVVVLAGTVNAQTYTDLFNFNGTDGAFPVGTPAQGRDGNLYGITNEGGLYNCPGYNGGCGVAFRIAPSGLTVLYNFGVNGSVDGAEPNGGLTLGTDGDFYGTTWEGGDFCCNIGGYGTIFKITPSGNLTNLHDFTGTDGAQPLAPPIQGSDGNFYGTTWGTVYKITPAGTFTALGSLPGGSNAPLLQATDGNFYGTTVNGGDANYGTVFKMTPAGVVTILYNFDLTHGASPYGPVIQGSDGNLYGTASVGGTYSSEFGGVAFMLTLQGAITVLHNFGGSNDGDILQAGLIQATDGNFYGATMVGGAKDNGVIFQMTPAGGYSILYNFGRARGDDVRYTPLQHTNGEIFGLASEGGTSNGGVVFSFKMGLRPFVSFVSAAGKVGATVEILGQGFKGTTSVSFNGTAAEFRVVANTFLGAVVPTGATTGPVTVTTPSGTLTSNKPFLVLP
jgi:uncharacterized repeat protein (TIGR03803 family)